MLLRGAAPAASAPAGRTSPQRTPPAAALTPVRQAPDREAAARTWPPLAAPVVAPPAPPRPSPAPPPVAAPAPATAPVEEQRVVELVRKEVRSALAARPPAGRPGREELGRLADRVVAGLERRLLVERERRGL